MVKITSKNIVFPDGIREGNICIEDGKIVSVNSLVPCDEVLDFGTDYVMPGLFDIHTHGASNFDYCESGVDGILTAAKYQLSRGATSIMPTITSSTFERTYAALEKVEKAIEMAGDYNNFVGVHLEGPYLSLNQCGAQDKSFITEPIEKDYVRLIERFGKIIKRWDYAPERDTDFKFTKYLKEHGIIASAGHTDAKYDEIKKAYELGCNLVTHLYSCTSTITRNQGFRILGVTECVYLFDDMYIEIISDGKHLPPELLQLIFKTKDNDKIILVTDSLKVAGSNEKYSSVGTVKCVIEDGVCKLFDKSGFAGSIATADMMLNVCVKQAKLHLEKAVKMATENPARLLGLQKGSFKVGYDADVAVFDKDLSIKSVILRGKKVF